ncbi:hypothetical protein [Methylobacterium gnaphalii]|uniref:Uncharacterized protein n=1 Tax=Methylobacterium gnaphalii TaxID=1010610 RepID=A0A512JJ81_9HYPH|nr:hypothetical protein [Methylobacterium gnaphalii]GEP09994.1 hypothetical protein MGN01_18390 [Methylobacterium gnaphalii]GJD68988.1 hypothetical protein MMMDOFMJ_1914 [Methylobacterium gnaphalii]GLS48265.1 hypothetical protein GCM10007885_11090 [Methylobacterium gnaphalii]
MNKIVRTVIAALVLAGTASIPVAEAAASKGKSARTEAPAKAETCRPKWPYIVLTCVA